MLKHCTCGFRIDHGSRHTAQPSFGPQRSKRFCPPVASEFRAAGFWQPETWGVNTEKDMFGQVLLHTSSLIGRACSAYKLGRVCIHFSTLIDYFRKTSSGQVMILLLNNLMSSKNKLIVSAGGWLGKCALLSNYYNAYAMHWLHISSV